ncbi:reverse transcriptase domain-containing protein [Tanacetum coccineum]
MSAMANTTPICTTPRKTTIPKERGRKRKKTRLAARMVNIQDFCEEHYEDILPVIMDKIRSDKRKEVHTRLDFGDNTKRMGYARRRKNKRKMCRTESRHGHRSRDRGRSRIMKRGRTSESPLSRVSESGTSDEGRWKSASKRQKLIDEEDLAVPWTCEEVECWAMLTWCHMFNSTLIRTARVWFDELPPKSIDGYNDLKAAFLAYFMQQKKYVKDPVEIHNIKQRDGETLEDFMERFKVETGCMKGAPECMRISGFMHGVNNLELTKRLNEHVPKTIEEMMIVTTTFIRGETVAASKKKGHTP